MFSAFIVYRQNTRAVRVPHGVAIARTMRQAPQTATFEIDAVEIVEVIGVAIDFRLRDQRPGTRMHRQMRAAMDGRTPALLSVRAQP